MQGITFDDLKKQDRFLKQDIYYPELLKKIKKHTSYMQPIYEAISNAFEATVGADDSIVIRLNFSKSLISDVYEFVSFEIQDSGVGFNDANFYRFKNLYDNTKGYNNFGTGRLQFLHFFRYTIIDSYYQENDNFYHRKLFLSKYFFDANGGVIWEDSEKVDEAPFLGTNIIFTQPLESDDKDKYGQLSTEDVKLSVLTRYLSRLCVNRNNLQEIRFERYINDVLDVESKCEIFPSDIPEPLYSDKVTIHYSHLSVDNNTIVEDSKTEDFEISSFELSPSVIHSNQVKILSKGEAYDVPNLDFSLVKESPKFQNDNYVLFLVSSDYFTKADSDLRGSLRLYTRKDLFNSANRLFGEKNVVLCEHIQAEVITSVTQRFPKIKDIQEQQQNDIEELAEMFSLDRRVLSEIGVQAGETDQSILKRVYQYNAERTASNDANIRNILKKLSALDPSQKTFESKFNKQVKELTELVSPLMRKELTQYVSRRKLVLELMQRILDKSLSCFENSTDKHKDIESYLHNLIFPKRSTDPLESNLWMINDDFIHYKGFSEHRLIDIQINGERFFRDDLTEEEIENLNSFGQKRLEKRPDILLFPTEHKCVIIELKTPDKDVSSYISQVIKYASLIRQYCKDKFEIVSFYGYLIGDNFSFDDIINANPYFEKAYTLDYVYNPNQPINGGDARSKGHMYIEVIEYSTLLRRAQMRNKIFIDKIS